ATAIAAVLPARQGEDRGPFLQQRSLKCGESLWRLGPDPIESFDHSRAELRAAVRSEFLKCPLDWIRLAVGTSAGQRVEGISDEHDARRDRNLIACEVVGITGPVDPLVAPAGDLTHVGVQI